MLNATVQTLNTMTAEELVTYAMLLVFVFSLGTSLGAFLTRQRTVKNKDRKFGAGKQQIIQTNWFNQYPRQAFTSSQISNAAQRAEFNKEDF